MFELVIIYCYILLIKLYVQQETSQCWFPQREIQEMLDRALKTMVGLNWV